MNIATAINKASEKLKSAGIAEARREAYSLLAFVLQRDSAFLIAHSEDQLAANQKMIFDACVSRRSSREPLQYITGRQEFYGLEFEVPQHVLIPRPETEILVEDAIRELNKLWSPAFCEIGIGSGCISTAILYNVPNATAIGIDISNKALLVAANNAEKHYVNARLTLREGNGFTDLSDEFDLIVSNPPYIPDSEIDDLQPEVRDFEPRTALAGGEDGLDLVRRIVDDSRQFLRPGGVLLMEIGHGQAKQVANLFEKQVWDDLEFLPDLQNIKRVVRARLK